MDQIDAVTLAALALLDLAFLINLRWRRGHSSRVERRIVRALSLALRHRVAA
jgi:hypothetical protein